MAGSWQVRMIYLDNNATTRVAEEAVRAMDPFWREQYGNASSLHRVGQIARHAVETARQQLATLIGAKPRQIIFTSGGTESDNLAILGTLAAYPKKRHIVTTSVEHPAVLSLCQRLETQGYRVTYVDVNDAGHLDLDAFADALDDETALASVMYANSETGVIFPIRQIAEIAADRKVPLHVDAVQALGKLNIDAAALGASLLSFSSHKVHGPKGAGALFVGRGTRLRSQLVGGRQERDIRPGTEDVPAIVGFGAAAQLARRRLDEGLSPIAGLRDRLENGILERISFAHVIGDRRNRTVNTTNIGFERLLAEAILIALSEAGICASSGSACSSGSLEPSHVLNAMRIDPRIAHGAVRFSLSHETTDQEIDQALEIIQDVVKRLASIGTMSE
jgi:cysteine desulfurase